MKAETRYFEMKGGKSFYAITPPDHCLEYQIIGKKFVVHNITAKILPERMLIHDILNDQYDRYEEITELEFEKRQAECLASLQNLF